MGGAGCGAGGGGCSTEPTTAQSSNRPKLSYECYQKYPFGSHQKEAPDLFVSFLCDKDTKDDGQSKMTKIQDEIKEIMSDLDIKRLCLSKKTIQKLWDLYSILLYKKICNWQR